MNRRGLLGAILAAAAAPALVSAGSLMKLPPQRSILSDDAYLQALIDRAARNGGGQIIIPPGRYYLGQTLRLQDASFVIVGSAFTALPGFQGDALLDFNNCANSRIESCYLDARNVRYDACALSFNIPAEAASTEVGGGRAWALA